MNIPISTAKRIREELKARAVVIFARYDIEESVATHGDSPAEADGAAQLGNLMKDFLGWPARLCGEKPLPRICQNCRHWYGDDPGLEKRCGSPLVGNAMGFTMYTPPGFGCIHFDPK